MALFKSLIKQEGARRATLIATGVLVLLALFSLVVNGFTDDSFVAMILIPIPVVTVILFYWVKAGFIQDKQEPIK